MTQQTYDANDVLMGGSNPPAWKFEEPGITHEGFVNAPPQARQEREYDPTNPGGGALKTYPSGDPIMGVIVEMATNERDASVDNDDGRRTFYIEGRYIKEAVRAGVRAAGAAGLEIGGRLTVTFTHREDPTDKRSRKYWQVAYTPAGNAALMTDQAPTQAPQQWQAPANTPAPTRSQPAPTVPPAWAKPDPTRVPVPAQQAAPDPAPALIPQSEEAAQLAAFNAWRATQKTG